MLLELDEKRFPGADDAILADIEVDLEAGDFVALLGPSGVGKTTLLRILAGLDSDYSGHCTGTGGGSATGFLFQEPRLMPWLTAEQNVALVVGGNRDAARQALLRVKMEDAAALYPRQLSGGMQRRVALARAIVHEPKLLLLDEPFVSLDQPAAESLQDLLLEYWRQARPTVVLVSHNLDEAIRLADRLLFLGGAPAGVIHACPVELVRERHDDPLAVREHRERLLAAHPGLLSGTLGQLE